ncbi:MAG: hypothetical protein EXR58_07760 [Chloroflexi bacterium]|nr:hypothetical protein [Chloroflexota bacterium]
MDEGVSSARGQGTTLREPQGERGWASRAAFAKQAALLDLPPALFAIVHSDGELDVVSVRVVDPDRHPAQAVGPQLIGHFVDLELFDPGVESSSLMM